MPTPTTPCALCGGAFRLAPLIHNGDLYHYECLLSLEDNTMPKQPVTLVEFKKLCDGLDHAYAFSDDHRVWQSGRQRMAEAQDMARALLRAGHPEQTILSIYNSVVEKRFSSHDSQEMFKWTKVSAL